MEEGNPGQRSGRHGLLVDPLLRRRGRDHCFQDSLKGGAATLITLAYVFERIDWGVAAATPAGSSKRFATMPDRTTDTVKSQGNLLKEMDISNLGQILLEWVSRTSIERKS
jgi:hypothetical protein